MGEITFTQDLRTGNVALDAAEENPHWPKGYCGPCAKRRAANAHVDLVVTGDNRPVNLANLYRGRSAFLICGGPSFARLDHDKLRLPGILTLGVNNSVKTFRPNLWCCVDPTDHFLRSIWLDPRILKFAPMSSRNQRVFHSDDWRYLPLVTQECPATFFYHRHCGFNAANFLTADSFCWGNDDKSGGARSVMLVALRLLYYLGVRRVFLLGADFKMSAQYAYHFDQGRAPGSVKGNNASYATLRERFKQLRPVFDAAGLRVLNCNPDSAIEAFDKIGFDDAVALALKEWGAINVAAERTAGLYDQAKPGQAKKPAVAPPPNCKPVPKSKFWRATPPVPKLAHFVWLGGPLPQMAADNIARFRALHPGWEVKVHTAVPSDMPDDLWRAGWRVSQLCQRSDLVRLWALFREGGVYLDTDVYAVRPFDELRHFEHAVFWNGTTDRRIANCVLIAAPGSAAFGEALRRCSERAKNPAAFERTEFGPKLLTALHRAAPAKLNVLPNHYVGPLKSKQSCFNLMKMTDAQQTDALAGIEDRMTDGVWPFAVHSGGIPDDQMPPGLGRSSFTKPLGRGDAILRRLPRGPVAGAEVGVFRGRLAAYLLGHRDDLRLTLVDAWQAAAPGSRYAKTGDGVARLTQAELDAARDAATASTDFAADRRSIVVADSVAAAAAVADGSLDFVFVDADHSLEGVRGDIAAWQPKLKPGGLLGGHDLDYRPREWGVRRAAEEAAARLGAALETDADHTWFLRAPAREGL